MGDGESHRAVNGAGDGWAMWCPCVSGQERRDTVALISAGGRSLPGG